MVRNSSSGTTVETVETVDNTINAQKLHRSRAISRCTKNVDWLIPSSNRNNVDTGYRPHGCKSSKLNPHAKPFVPCLTPTSSSVVDTPMSSNCAASISQSEFVDVDMESSSEESASICQLRLSAGVASIPHPAKKHKGGEDAHFVSNDNSVIAIADGVGGWEALGVDSGLYSRSLMNFACTSANAGIKNPSELLKIAHERCLDIQGSTTACIISLIDNKLHAANLGDSGFLIIRNGALVYKTKEQQHYFNCPFQIGSSRDMPEDAQRIVVDDLQPGDIIVAATDGVFDNLFSDAIVRIVSDSISLDPNDIAQRLAAAAHTIGCDPSASTPFQDGAQKTGQLWHGGKLDDITCIVAKVSLQTVPSSNSIGA